METIVTTAPAQYVSESHLRESVQSSVEKYFSHLDGAPAGNLYDLVLDEIEEPLLKAVLLYTKANQSKSAIVLGISRGTLRKKMKKYGLLE